MVHIILPFTKDKSMFTRPWDGCVCLFLPHELISLECFTHGSGHLRHFSELTNKYLDVINTNSESILCVNTIWYNVTEACFRVISETGRNSVLIFKSKHT